MQARADSALEPGVGKRDWTEAKKGVERDPPGQG